MSSPYNFRSKFMAWMVHIFTACGMLAGFYSIVFTTEDNFFAAFLMLLIAIIIDGVDGTFARIFQVEKVLPNVSGKTMDYVIDFANYAIIPAFIIYRAELIPGSLQFFTIGVILITSSLYYAKEGMVSKDYYFIGFPVMWNLVAFYLYYIFLLDAMLNFILIIICAILHFIPIKYLYPSRSKKFMTFNLLFTVLILGSSLMVMLIEEGYFMSRTNLGVFRMISIFSLLYFCLLSIYHTWFDRDTKGI